MKTEKITCDTCGFDITCKSGKVGHRLVLVDEHIPDCGGDEVMSRASAVYEKPFLRRAYHFCGFKCLEAWLPG